MGKYVFKVKVRLLKKSENQLTLYQIPLYINILWLISIFVFHCVNKKGEVKMKNTLNPILFIIQKGDVQTIKIFT